MINGVRIFAKEFLLLRNSSRNFKKKKNFHLAGDKKISEYSDFLIFSGFSSQRAVIELLSLSNNLIEKEI